MSLTTLNRDVVRAKVQAKYGEAAKKVLAGGTSCCSPGTSCCGNEMGVDPVTRDLYSEEQSALIPAEALTASLGCGNPTMLAQLKEGETVLDLGSGGGIDVLLSAKRVGPTGHAYGLDMTDAMLELAEKNREASGLDNVTFLKGQIEAIPLPSSSVDVIVSNCVINLSADKDAVFREAIRVLKPGGRLAVSDIVTEGDIPESVRGDLEALVGCVAGALDRNDYAARLKNAGFNEVEIEVTRRYTWEDAKETGGCFDAIARLSDEERERLDGKIMSAFIRTRKPAL